MSKRFIKEQARSPGAALLAMLAALVLAACSAPMPAPPASAPAPQTMEPAIPSTAAPAAEPSRALKKQFATALDAMRAGKDEQAITLLTAIAKQNPQLASPYTNLGILYYRNGRFSEAEAALKQATQSNTQDVVAINYLGMTYRALGRFTEARAAYEQALAIKPDYANALLNLAILSDLYLGDLPRAALYYQQYRDLVGDSDPQIAGWMTDLEQRMKNTGGARAP